MIKRTISNGSQIPRLVLLALDRHQSGHLFEAKELYDQIFRANPGHPDALHFSGLIAHQSGKSEIAGTQEQLRAQQGLSADDIARSAETAFQHRTSVSRQVC